MLYPGVPIDCVVSLGTGVVPPVPRPKAMSSYFETGSAVIESAVDVDRAHEALAAMLDLSGCVYERCPPPDPGCCAIVSDKCHVRGGRRLPDT